MSQSQARETEWVREVYRYAAELMKSGSAGAEIKTKLMEKGLDEQAATLVVNNLVALRSRAMVEAGKRNMLWGTFWCLAGIIVTAGTYLLAAPGGTFIVALGATVFGARQFYRGYSQAGVCGRRTACLCVVTGVGLLVFLSWRYLMLSDAWWTYKDERLGFTVSYPALSSVEVQQQEGYYKVAFVPHQGSEQQYRQFEIWVQSETDEGEPSFCDFVGILKNKALGQSNAQISTSRARCIDSMPGGEIAFESELSEAPMAWWVAVSRFDGALYWLVAAEAPGSVGLLEPRYARFVSSFRFGASSAELGPCATPVPLQCPAGYDPYVDTGAGFSVCYPAQWVALCASADENSPLESVVFVSPFAPYELSISLQFDPTESGIDDLTDEQWVDVAFDEIVRKQASVVSFPRITLVDGRRCLQSAWEIRGLPDGPASGETTYRVWLADDGRTWFVNIAGPSERLSELESVYHEFVASFHVLPRE